MSVTEPVAVIVEPSFIAKPSRNPPWACMFCGREISRRGRCCSHAKCRNRKAYFHYHLHMGRSPELSYKLAMEAEQL